jgi:hypothetical protein
LTGLWLWECSALRRIWVDLFFFDYFLAGLLLWNAAAGLPLGKFDLLDWELRWELGSRTP